jgi:hypothetical protein
MAQKSEEIEAALAYVQDLVTAYYIEAAKEACETTNSDPPVARLKTAEQMARAGRYLKLFRETGRRAVAAIDALPRAAASSDPEETPMNGRPDWTPERVTALHAEVRRRMAKLVASRETRGLAGDGAGGTGRGVPPGPYADGAPPDPPG